MYSSDQSWISSIITHHVLSYPLLSIKLNYIQTNKTIFYLFIIVMHLEIANMKLYKQDRKPWQKQKRFSK